MKINKELLKGSTSILLLNLLSQEDMYGYQITQKLKSLSDNTFELKEGTLYPALHALEKSNAVESYWFDTDEGRRRRYYRITDSGRKLLSHKQKEWRLFVNTINDIIGEKAYE